LKRRRRSGAASVALIDTRERALAATDLGTASGLTGSTPIDIAV
jgi:hypothetical protein